MLIITIIVVHKSYVYLIAPVAVREYLEIRKPGYMPDGFIDDSLLPLAALPSQDCETVHWGLLGPDKVSENELIIEPTNSIYEVIDYSNSRYGSLKCYRGIRFNSRYVVVDSDVGLRATSARIVDASPDTIKTILLILALVDDNFVSHYVNNFYEYDFVELDDRITLVLKFMGPSLDCPSGYKYGLGFAPSCAMDVTYNVRYWTKSLSFNKSSQSVEWPIKTAEAGKVEISKESYRLMLK